MYNVCLIGHGYWGEKLARNFNNSEFFNLVSIADIKKRNLSLAKKKYPSIDLNKNYIDDNSPVEFDQPLFEVDPS